MSWQPAPSLTAEDQARLVALLATALERALLANNEAQPELAIPAPLCVYTDDADPTEPPHG